MGFANDDQASVVVDDAAVGAGPEQAGVVPAARSGWRLSVYEDAGEAGGCYQSNAPARLSQREGPAADPERAAAEAARRARGKVRRYCAANRLNRLGTLTYRGGGCHDPRVLRDDVAGFFRRLRAGVGGRPPAYLWTGEWHKTGHGLHVHFAVGEYIRRSLIDQAWGHGFVHIKLLGYLPVGTGTVGQARKAAGYLSKYVGKAFEEDGRIAGLHRYEVAQGFEPVKVEVWGRTRPEAVREACRVMGDEVPERIWTSDEVEGWKAPPAVWVQWAG